MSTVLGGGPGTRPVCCYLMSTTLHCWPWPPPGVPLPSDREGQRGCAGGARFSTIQDFLTLSVSCLLLRSRAASGAPRFSSTICVIHDLYVLFCRSGTQIFHGTTIEAFINVHVCVFRLLLCGCLGALSVARMFWVVTGWAWWPKSKQPTLKSTWDHSYFSRCFLKGQFYAYLFKLTMCSIYKLPFKNVGSVRV